MKQSTMKDVFSDDLAVAKIQGFTLFIRVNSTPEGGKEVITSTDPKQADFVLEAYDEDMRHKHNNEVQIVSWCFA